MQKIFFLDVSGSMSEDDFESAAAYVGGFRGPDSVLFAIGWDDSGGFAKPVPIDGFLADPSGSVAGCRGWGIPSRIPEGDYPSPAEKVFLTDGLVTEDIKGCFDKTVFLRDDVPPPPTVH